MTGRQEYDRTKDRQRILGKYMIDFFSLFLIPFFPSHLFFSFLLPHLWRDTHSSEFPVFFSSLLSGFLLPVEEPGEQFTVVFALIATETTIWVCATACGGGGGGCHCHPPTSSHLGVHGIPPTRNSAEFFDFWSDFCAIPAKFREIPRNSAEFRRNCTGNHFRIPRNAKMSLPWTPYSSH